MSDQQQDNIVTAAPVYNLYISTEQAFRKVIGTLKEASKNAFSPNAEQYKETVKQLEGILQGLTETGKISI